MNRFSIPFVLSLIICSCGGGPKEIEYGLESCHHCQMIISQKGYGAEIVTTTGKRHVFDAIECMLNYIQSEDQDIQVDKFLVTHINDPGKLKDAASSIYIRSGQLPSPMGMFITAIQYEEKEMMLQQFGGMTYTWNELKSEFSDLPRINQ